MMLKLAPRFVLPLFQRSFLFSKTWSRFIHSRSSCYKNLLLNQCPFRESLHLYRKSIYHNNCCTKLFFHSSVPRNALPPVFVLLMRPLTKFIAIVFGRSIRMWWKRLPPVKREYYRKFFAKRKFVYFALITPIPAGALYFYVNHLDETPITKRKRFIAFSNEQVKQLADIEQEVLTDQYKQAILPANHPAYCRVLRVVSRLLDCNKDISGITEHTWRIIVIDDQDVNAFVLPNGTIFIYAGMLSICSNDNQLSIVLAHEMSHTILHHTAERMSNAQMIESLLFIPIVLIWALLPDLGALLAQWFSGVVAKMLLHLPFSRLTEMEADDVGLTLAAKACFDIREAPCFWKKMKAIGDGLEELEWLSTHPSYDTRQIILEELIPTALKLRDTCQCPKLSSQDPRLSIDSVLKMITQKRMLRRQELQSKA